MTQKEFDRSVDVIPPNYSRHYIKQMAGLYESIPGMNPALTIYKQFIEQAKEYSAERLNVAESKVLAKKYKTRHKQCFGNCAKIAGVRKDLFYVEGFGTAIITCDHAWLTDKDGNIYDPTWCLSDDSPQPPIDYFGMIFSVENVKKAWSIHQFNPTWMTLFAEYIRNAQVI